MLSAWVQWIVVAGILIVLEMLVGSFVLLVFGVACLMTAIVAYFGVSIAGQLLCCSVIAGVGGLYFVYRLRHPMDQAMASVCDDGLDRGQKVEVVAWLSHGMARVRYRGAEWEARVQLPEIAVRDAPFFIVKREDHVLWIANDLDKMNVR